MKRVKLILIVLSTLFLQFNLFSQSLYEVPVEEITNNSSLIVEGKVVGQTCFWNTKHTMIYTENKILVYKSFKGTPTSDTIKVITVGGQVGNSAIVASDLLDLELNDFGLFYCTPNTLRIKSPQDQTVLLDVYSSQQGFVKYDLNTLTASTPFKKYNSITNNLYQAVEAKTGGRFRTIHPWSQSPEQLRATTISALEISSFSPTTVNAGALLDPTNNLLTITGTDFGDASGSAAVYFDDSNDGTGGTPWTVAYNSPLIVSWSNTEIKIRVPERAGNGTVGVTNSTGSSVNSSGSLNVRYSVMTFYFTLSAGLYKYFKEGNLMNNNGTGGYTIKYSTNSAGSGIDLDASAAKATFQRALNTWKEISGYNITEGGTTTNQVIGDDGINTIMYDNTNTEVARLSAGTLGVCYSYFYINGSSLSDFTTNQAYKTGFDIIIRQDGVSSGTSNFTLGPCPPNATNYLQTDLETVLLHELGHSIGLMHINDDQVGPSVGQVNPPKLMNYSVGASTKRVSPDYSAYAGAAYLIQQQGNTYGGGLTEMIPLTTTLESKDNCPTTLPTAALATNTAVSFDMVHATSNSLTDPAYTNIRCNGYGASLTNNAYYAFKTGSTSSSTLTITVSGYGTTPSALASCSLLYPGILVTGFRLALYNVSGGLPTSPSGYGSPVACKEFSANGAISDFTGLAANTEYLLLVEGIENTKAAFNFTFTGTATASASNTAGAASSTPTLCINTALTNITHTTTGATGISNDNVTGANGLPAGVKAQWAGDLITISGTPTASGTFSYSIPLTGGTGSVNATGTITVTAAPTPTFTAQPGATACASTDVTYTTESGQTNYIWTVPGTLNTDYSITSGGVGTSSNTVTLKWLTAGSKAVTINYTSSGCTAASATSSTATTVSARPTPTFTAYPGSSACANTDQLYTTESGKTNYIWSVPGTLGVDYSITSGGIGTSSNTVTLQWLTTGSKTVTINYTSNGCTAASATSSTATTIYASPTPTFTAQPGATACIGSNVTYTTQSGQDFYYWTVPGTVDVDYTITAGGDVSDNTVTLKWLTAGSKTVTINYTNSSDCTAPSATSSTATTVSALPTPTFTAQPGATACANTDVTYTTESGKTNYVWSVPGTLNTDYSITSGGVGTSSNTVTLKWLTAGSKTVTINYTSGGCTAASATSSTATTVSAAPTTANAGADQTTCVSTSVTLAGNTPTVGTGAWSIVSGTGGTITTTSSPTSNFSGTAGATYTLRWTTTNGPCTSTDDVVITFSTAPTAGITNNTAATELTCVRTSISLTATGGGNYSWSNGTIVVGTSATLSVTAPATYTVTVTGTNGCTATSAVIITQSGTPPTAGITNNSSTTVLTCSVSTISLTATGGVSYSWSNGTTVVGTDPALSVMIPGTYTVTVTGASGCTATSAVTITQTGSMPTIAIANSAATTELSCTATSITLTASGSTYYYWTKNGAIVSTSAALTVTTPGTYIATGTSGSGGCPGSNSVTITQNANLPVASITNNTGATQVDCTNTAISLTATGGTSYLWSDGSTSANLSVTAAGTYTVTVTNSGSGCTSTSSIAITKNISASTAATLSGSTTISSGGTANLKVAITGGKAPFTITLSDGTVKTNYYPLKPTIAVSPTTTTSYTLVSVIGSNGCAGTGNSGTASVTVSTPGTTFWTGTVSRLWNVGGNWSAGTIPNENDAITIGTNANQPQLNIDFSVGGSLTLSGTGTTLTVNAGKSLSVASGATVDFGSKEVTFKSDATGTAQLGRMQGTLSNASNVVVERYFPATNRAYRFISASATTTGSMKFNWMENATAGTTAGYPFAAGTATNPTAGYGTQITGTGGNTNGFDASGTNNPSIFSLNNASQAWAAVANTSGTLNAGDAYRILIRGDRGINLNSNAPAVTATTLRTRGTLKTGTHTVSSLSSAWGGWNLIGNPYNAQIDMRAVSATNMTASYTVWDPTRGTAGAYVVFNYGTGVSSNILSSVNELLQPGQAFFVQTENPGAASFTFEEVDKTPAGTQTSVFSPLNVYPVLNSALYYTDSLAKNKPEMDAFAVVFDNNFSDAIDREDGQKYGNTDENMSVNRNGSLLALELRSMYNSATIIPISITTYKRQNYTMRLKWNNPINAGYDAKLVDNYTSTETAINFSGNTDYVYTVNSSILGSIAADRFKIVFVPNAALPVSGLTLTGAAKGNSVALQYEALNERDMQGYAIERSADGTVFSKLGEQQPVNGTSVTNRYNYTDNNPLTGINYYRIKGSSINGQLQYSNVIAVKTGSLLPTVTVAPNPIANKVLNLKLSHLTKGSYRMTVTDVTGRTVFSKEMVYDGVSSEIKTSLPSNLKPGNYYIRLSGEGCDFTEKFIIQ